MDQPIRRIVTGHNDEGKAIIRSDEQFYTEIISSEDAKMATIWTSQTVPADCNDEMDGRLREVGTTLKGGSVIRIVDMLPSANSPFHRTSSIDYGIILKGNIELILENGEKTIAGPGDIIIQRGTMHQWRNPSSTEVCRIVFVLIEAKAFVFDGKELPEEMIH